MHIRRGKGHKDRFVALPDLTCALRSLWPKQHNPVWLFPNGAGSMESIKNATTHMDRGGVQATMTAVVKDSEIKKILDLHASHSIATQQLEQGLSLIHIQHLLGHASPSTTACYAHSTELTEQDTIAAINQLTDTSLRLRFQDLQRLILPKKVTYLPAQSIKFSNRLVHMERIHLILCS